MKLCRFQNENEDGRPRPGLTLDGATVLDLSTLGIETLEAVLEQEDPMRFLERLAESTIKTYLLSKVTLLGPVERQEIWAAGVTYLRSKKARMEESEAGASLYDRVYEADRPELFFKSMPAKVVGPTQAVGIRKDARWNVPEPELALVLNSKGKLVGYTIGNDMSSRDIEGENALYLPQAKVYKGSCAVGPWIVVGASEKNARDWNITLEISRDGSVVFQGETRVDRIKRSFEELVGFLFRSQVFEHGAVLLTGTGIVPPDGFSLREGDRVRIGISGIGHLENTVKEV